MKYNIITLGNTGCAFKKIYIPNSSQTILQQYIIMLENEVQLQVQSARSQGDNEPLLTTQGHVFPF